MKKVFFALILIIFNINFCLANDDLSVYEEECKSVIDKPKVKFFSSYGKLTYDFSKDEDFLRKEMEKKLIAKNMEMVEGFHPAGITNVRDNFEVKMNVGEITVSKGYRCFYPEYIEVYLGYSFPVIYISKNLEKGSCMYDITLRHERTHMQMFIEALDEVLPKIKKLVRQLYDKVGVKIAKPSQESKVVAEQLRDEYVKVVEDRVNRWREEVEAEQSKLDSIEHYIMENRICEDVEEYFKERSN